MATRLDGPANTPGIVSASRERLPSTGSGGTGVGALGDVLGIIGQGSSEIAAGLERQLAEEKSRLRGVDVAKYTAAFRERWSAELSSRTAAYDGRSDLHKPFSDDISADVENVLAGIDDVQTRSIVEQRLVQTSSSYRISAQNNEVQARRAQAYVDLQTTTDTVRNQIISDPAQFEPALDEIPALLAAVPESLREKYGTELRESYAISYVTGLNDVDPNRLQKELGKGYADEDERGQYKEIKDRLDEMLTPAAKSSAIAANESELHSLAVEARRAAALKKAEARADQIVLNADMRERKQEARRTLSDMKAVFASGFSPGNDEIKLAIRQANDTGDAQMIAQAKTLAASHEFMTGARLQTPNELAGVIAQMRTQASGGVNRAGADLIVAAEKLHSTMQTQIARDPISWAGKIGLTDIVPLDFDSDDLPAQLGKRRDQAAAIADYYNTEVKFFTKSEVQAIRLQSDAGGAQMLAAANTIAGAFDADATRALAEISDIAPSLAHLGGMLQAGGDQVFAQDATSGIALMNIKGFESRLPKPTLRKAVQAGVYGNAFMALPGTAEAATKAAQAVYEERALRSGVVGDDLPGQEDSKLYSRALQESMGATFVGKRQFGGIGDVQDSQVIVPSWLRADKFDNVVAKLKDTDWLAGGAFGAPVDEDGVVVSDKVLKNAYLVSVGHDRYRVSITNPVEGEQYLGAVGAPDGLYILDMSKLHTEMRRDKRFKKWVFDAVEDAPVVIEKRMTGGEAMQIAFARANDQGQGGKE